MEEGGTGRASDIMPTLLYTLASKSELSSWTVLSTLER